MELFTLQALWAVLAIILIDIVLAGDNALVIGMAANKLPPELRKRAIFWGTFGAVAIRFVSVAALTYLLMIPGLRLVGALALIWIGWRLVFDQHTDESVAGKTTLRGAITTIIVADAVMGIDNALGIAAAANGDFGLVIFGLLISVPIILFGSSVVSKVLARWPDVVFAGSFVLFVVAFQMLFKEPLLAEWLAPLPGWVLTSLPWTGGFTIMAVQFAQARLHLVKRYLFKK
jgi:YjbE family integral membrane protein